MKGMERAQKEALEQVLSVKKKMEKIKHKLAILSGKEGIGKSTFTANLAIALVNKKYVWVFWTPTFTGPTFQKF